VPEFECLRGTSRAWRRGGPGFLAPDQPAGALIAKVIQGRMYFSVNHRAGAPFRDHEGCFEFDVSSR